MNGVIPKLLEEVARLEGLRFTHSIHSGGERFDFEAVLDGIDSARCFASNLPTHMPSGNERGDSGRRDRGTETVEWTFVGGGKPESEEVATLADVLRVLQTWRNEALLRQSAPVVERLLVPVMAEFSAILQTLASLSPLGPTADGAARLDAQILALSSRVEERLRANVPDPARLDPMLATLAVGLKEARAVARGHHAGRLATSLLESIAPWIKMAHAR